MDRKYSIIIPIHNGQERLEACLGSIAAQSYENFEVLMIDDHSVDASAAICRKWAQKDARFVCYESEEYGVSAARNMGLAHATGDIISFCDDDDEMMPGALILIEQIYERMPDAGIVITGVQKCKPDGKTEQELTHSRDLVYGRDKLLTALFSDHNIMGSVWNKFFPHQYVENIRFAKNLDYCEDMLYVVETILKNRDCRGYVCSGITYKYIMSQQSATNRTERLFDSERQLKYMYAFGQMERQIEEAGQKGNLRDRQTAGLLGLVRKKKYIVAAETYCDFELNDWQKQTVRQIMKDNQRSMLRHLLDREVHRTLYLLYRVIKKSIHEGSIGK